MQTGRLKWFENQTGNPLLDRVNSNSMTAKWRRSDVQGANSTDSWQSAADFGNPDTALPRGNAGKTGVATADRPRRILGVSPLANMSHHIWI